MAAVVATGLLGLENAQADPQPSAPAVAATPVLPGPAAPAERTPAAEPAPRHSTTDRDREDVGRTDRDAAGTTADADTPRGPRRRATRPADDVAPPGTARRPQRARGLEADRAERPGRPGGADHRGRHAVHGHRAGVRGARRPEGLAAGRGKIVRGRSGSSTATSRTHPAGTFHVQWKAEQYTSREYLTQMPYSVFFADGGIAFHEGAQDTPSAGCVKLVQEDAKAFFYFLQVGDQVQIH
ncbi:hypothetical protein BJF90_20715 [Pseudonocardia sp. CNS-004]|nr:hypothetical protein BJF90_20715 [Pseudonocardia sp. CNS-004]